MMALLDPALVESSDLALGVVALPAGEAADEVAAGLEIEVLPVIPPTGAETEADGTVALLPPGKVPFTQPSDAGKGPSGRGPEKSY